MSIADVVPSKKDHELETMRRNALKVFNETVDPMRKNDADELLTAIEIELEKRHLPGMIESFTQENEGGFYGDVYLEQERNYKLEASKACLELLAKDEFESLISESQTDELFSRVKKLVNMTNLIQQSFERPKLFDAMQEDRGKRLFYPALFDCIHGEGSPVDRLDRFSKTLIELNLGKWTYATYFLFLSDPDNCIFVKPEGLKKSLHKACYQLNYEAQPSGKLYAEILAFANWLQQKLIALEPRDMIDVQSFMWHMAPTGIHSEN